MSPTMRVARAATAVVALAGIGVGIAAGLGAFAPAPLTPVQRAAAARAAQEAAFHQALARQAQIVANAAALVAVPPPTKAGSEEPVSPASLFSTPLPPHAVLGFVPYWEVEALTPADFSDSSMLSYFGVDVGATGGLDESGYGWNDMAQSSFTSFVSEAHAAGDSVLFTVSTTTPAVIAHLAKYPAATSTRLAAQLLAIVSTDHLDGVDLDIEGRATSERAGFVRFVTDLVAALHRGDPNGEIVLDTYPQSAGSDNDFFDVTELAPLVDYLFIMAYDMDDPVVPSANSPLASPTLGLSDVSSLSAYTKLLAPSKLLLGLPFYGYDFTTGDQRGSKTVTSEPLAVTYASILAAEHPASWDPGSETPYAVFERDGEWHQTWYDDPESLALKAALADTFHIAGVGAWALGQEGATTAMLAALDGGTAPLKLPLPSSSK